MGDYVIFRIGGKVKGLTPAICDKYRGYLFKVAMRITGNVEYAEDVVQETMCKAIKLSGTLCGKDELEIKNYLVKAVRNNAFTYMNRILREKPSENPFAGAEVDIVIESVLAAETKEQMFAALSKLTERQRMVLVLMFYERWTLEEIAEELHITQDGVRMLKKRGLDNMREILVKEGWDK